MMLELLARFAPFLTYHLWHEHCDVELMGLSPQELGITMRSKVFEDFCDQSHDEEVIKVHHPWLAGPEIWHGWWSLIIIGLGGRFQTFFFGGQVLYPRYIREMLKCDYCLYFFSSIRWLNHHLYIHINLFWSLMLQMLIWFSRIGIETSGITLSQAGVDLMVRAWFKVIKITTEGSGVQGISPWFQELCSSALRQISHWSVVT